jgi:hypothetical protein
VDASCCSRAATPASSPSWAACRSAAAAAACPPPSSGRASTPCRRAGSRGGTPNSSGTGGAPRGKPGTPGLAGWMRRPPPIGRPGSLPGMPMFAMLSTVKRYPWPLRNVSVGGVASGMVVSQRQEEAESQEVLWVTRLRLRLYTVWLFHVSCFVLMLWLVLCHSSAVLKSTPPPTGAAQGHSRSIRYFNISGELPAAYCCLLPACCRCTAVATPPQPECSFRGAAIAAGRPGQFPMWSGSPSTVPPGRLARTVASGEFDCNRREKRPPAADGTSSRSFSRCHALWGLPFVATSAIRAAWRCWGDSRRVTRKSRIPALIRWCLIRTYSSAWGDRVVGACVDR